jgi:TP53 regulating kinase and related kinases
MDKLIAQGAEAKIIKQGNIILKDRIPKGYRIKELDEKLRKQRTKKEAKLLEKASSICNVPKVLNVDKFDLNIEFIPGDRLSETLNSYDKKKQLKVMLQLGQQVSKLHNAEIIHGDLTTSNTILKKDKVFIIDFGLGFQSSRIEDKACDLHLIKQAIEAKHYQNHEELFSNFLKGYTPKDKPRILKQLEKVELRGRNKH